MDDNNKNYELKRWYDEKPYADEVLSILKDLSLQSHYDIAREVLNIIDVIKENTRELEDPPLSIGIQRVKGLYNQSYGRRWYDKNLPVNRIFRSASTLQNEDFQTIMQGISASLRGKNDKQ